MTHPAQPHTSTVDSAADPAVLPHLADVVDDPAAEPSPALQAQMYRIATGYRGVAYDPAERPAEQLAIRRAAYAAGLTPVPDDTIRPRSLRGCTPPEPATPPADAAQQAAAAALAAAAYTADITLDHGAAALTEGSPAAAGWPDLPDHVLTMTRAVLTDLYRAGWRHGRAYERAHPSVEADRG